MLLSLLTTCKFLIRLTNKDITVRLSTKGKLTVHPFEIMHHVGKLFVENYNETLRQLRKYLHTYFDIKTLAKIGFKLPKQAA